MTARSIWQLATEPADAYHAEAATTMTSSKLRVLIDCPAKYRHLELTGWPREETAAMRLGTAAHTLILEGEDAFDCVYAVGGPINPRTGEEYGEATKAWTEHEAMIGRRCLRNGTWQTLADMRTSVMNHRIASRLLANGVAERVVRAEIEATACQARIDWLTCDDDGMIVLVDLKTCSNLDWFAADAVRARYDVQTTFYAMVLAEAAGIRVDMIRYIAVETEAPHRVGVFEQTKTWTHEMQTTIKRTLSARHEYIRSGVWPTGFEEPQLIEFSDRRR